MTLGDLHSAAVSSAMDYQTLEGLQDAHASGIACTVCFEGPALPAARVRDARHLETYPHSR